MSERPQAGTRSTYLIEHYRPGSSEAELDQVASRVREAIDGLAREGQPVRFRHATVVAIDESFLCVVEAASEDVVRLAYDRASVTFERISAARTDRS
jgi:hypothetical protein